MYFVSKHKIDDTKNLLQYIKSENQKFYLDYFNKYSIKQKLVNNLSFK